MLFIKYMLLVGCFGLFAIAIGAVLFDIYLAFELDRILRRNAPNVPPEEASRVAAAAMTVAPRTRRAIRWDLACKLAAVAALLGLAGSSILVVPDGVAAV